MATPAVSAMTGKGTCGHLGMTSTVEVGSNGSGAHFLLDLMGQADALEKVEKVSNNVRDLFKESVSY